MARLVGEVGYLRQMMDSMIRMTTGQGLEEESGETGDQVARLVEAPWLGGRMPDSGAREPGFESSTYDGAVDGDTLWRQQRKILVIVLGNKL